MSLHLLSLGGLLDGAIGFIVACFCPAVARLVKSYFVKETTAAKTAAASAVSSAASSVAKSV